MKGKDKTGEVVLAMLDYYAKNCADKEMGYTYGFMDAVGFIRDYAGDSTVFAQEACYDPAERGDIS